MSNSDYNSKNKKVALITGTSGGIGKATALELAKAGFVTYASARRLETIKELESQGCKIVRLDLTDEASMQAAVDQIQAQHGAIDLLVNNAADGRLGAIEEVSPEEWRKQFETNVFGLVRLIQLVLPGMRKQGSGRIINVSSVGGQITFPFGGSYHATKYALEAISDALRLELKPFGIEIAVVQPGGVKTALAETGFSYLHPKANSPYAKSLNNFREQSRQSFDKGQGVLLPEEVAAIILKAAQTQKPKTRYKVGSVARTLTLLRRILPDKTWDNMLERQLHLSN